MGTILRSDPHVSLAVPKLRASSSAAARFGRKRGVVIFAGSPLRLCSHKLFRLMCFLAGEIVRALQ
jgi:hypothetical protein